MFMVSALPLGTPPHDGVVVSSVEDAVAVLRRSRPADTLLLCSDDDYSRAARITREVMQAADVAVVAVGGTSTQRHLVTEFLLRLPEAAFGIAPAFSMLALRACRTRLATTSVAGLAAPAPSLRQHLRSFFPKASFEVDMVQGTVTSCAQVHWSVALGMHSAIASSDRRGTLDVTIDGVSGGAQDDGVGGDEDRSGHALEPTEVSDRGASPWRAREWVELTELEAPSRLYPRLLQTVPQKHCPVCSRVVAAPGCPFCGVTVMPSSTERVLFPARTKVA